MTNTAKMNIIVFNSVLTCLSNVCHPAIVDGALLRLQSNIVDNIEDMFVQNNDPKRFQFSEDHTQ